MIEVARARGVILMDEPYEGPGHLKIDGKGYAQISIHAGYIDGVRKFKKILLHRYIMNAPVGVTVDHINGNRLDNRRANLRLCSQAENNRNKGKFKNNKSGYKGVSWNAQNSKWVAQIQLNGKKTHLGYFSNPAEAHEAYVTASLEQHAEYSNESKLNTRGRLVNAI